MPRGLRGKLFRCNALPHRTQPAARISSAIFSSVRTRNSTNLESSRVVWHIRGVSLVLGTQERQVYPRGSQDSRGRPPSLPQPVRWGPRKSPSRKVLRNKYSANALPPVVPIVPIAPLAFLSLLVMDFRRSSNSIGSLTKVSILFLIPSARKL